MSFEIEEVQDMETAWPEVEALIRGIIDYHMPWESRVLRDDWGPWIREVMAVRDDSLTLLARNEAGDPVAFLNGAVTVARTIFDEAFAYIHNIFVTEEARAQGIGTALLQRFEDWAALCGAKELRLSVNAKNDSGFAFWSHAGFEVTEHSMRRPLGGKER